jgi:hypothetical protein
MTGWAIIGSCTDFSLPGRIQPLPEESALASLNAIRCPGKNLRVTIACVILVLSSAHVWAEPMTFELVSTRESCDQCTWIDASGVIDPSTPTALLKLLSEQEDSLLTASGLSVRLNSEGGDLAAGLELGRTIRAAGLSTEVGSTSFDPTGVAVRSETGTCESACAYAFLGGQQRTLGEDSQLGFHQFFDRDILSSRDASAFAGIDQLRDQYVIGVLVSYMVEMGVSAELIGIASSAGPEAMHYLSLEEATKLNVTTSDPGPVDWRVVPDGPRISLAAATDSLLRSIELFCVENDSTQVALRQSITLSEQDVVLRGSLSASIEKDIAPLISQLAIRIGDEELGLVENSLNASASALMIEFRFPTALLPEFLSEGTLQYVAPEGGGTQSEVVAQLLSGALPKGDGALLSQIMLRNCE